MEFVIGHTMIVSRFVFNAKLWSSPSFEIISTVTDDRDNSMRAPKLPAGSFDWMKGEQEVTERSELGVRDNLIAILETLCGLLHPLSPDCLARLNFFQRFDTFFGHTNIVTEFVLLSDLIDQELLELIRELDIDCIGISHLDPGTPWSAVFELHIGRDQLDSIRIVWIEAPFSFTALDELVSELKDLFDHERFKSLSPRI